MKQQQLTRAEEEIMQIIWEKGPCITGQIIKELEERTGKKPANSTISTMLRIMAEKGFLDFKRLGTYANLYYPKLQKEEYLKQKVERLRQNYFDGSLGRLVSFLVKSETLSDEERRQLAALLEEE